MSENNEKTTYKDHWFWGSIYLNKATYVQIALASIFINFFGLGSSFYIMTVYDKVMPNSAYSSLIALTIGMAIVIIFDFIMKLLRAHFIDKTGSQLEQTINDSVFKKILSHEKFIKSDDHKIISSANRDI